MPYLPATLMRCSLNQPIFSPLQQAMAPSYMLKALSGMTRSSLIPMTLPSPPQTGQAPRGLLKLNIYSSGSLNVIPSASKRLLNSRISGRAPASRTTYIFPRPSEKQADMEESSLVLRSASISPSIFTLSTISINPSGNESPSESAMTSSMRNVPSAAEYKREYPFSFNARRSSTLSSLASQRRSARR